ncbi:MAG: hypothetical protein HY644_00885 [Acidobacteria bacterium]|nr:hypothetical protein [Acidobacteriota bacterium]
MVSRLKRSVLCFLLMLFSAPLGFSSHTDVVLGEYYYPRLGNRWIERPADKTVFEPGDTIIIKDRRANLGRGGAVTGPIAYQLDDRSRNILEVIAQVSESVMQEIFGARRAPAQSEGWAIAVEIEPSFTFGSITASYTYIDPDRRNDPLPQQIIETIKKESIATYAKSSTNVSTLSVQSSANPVLEKADFDLAATLTPATDGVLYSWTQSSTLKASEIISKRRENGRLVSFSAPELPAGSQQGTIDFTVAATLNGQVIAQASISITVRKAGSPPPTESCTGTLVKQPRLFNVPAKACLSSDNLTQQPVNKAFKLKAVAQDPDGAPKYGAGPVGGVSPDAGILYGKWERISGTTKKLLGDEKKYPLPSNTSVEFTVDVPPETSTGTVTYRFTIIDGYDDGYYYDLQVAIAADTGVPTATLSVQSSANPVFEKADFDLVATLTPATDGVAYTWTQSSTLKASEITSKRRENGRLVSFSAPELPAGSQQGTIDFTVAATLNGQVIAQASISITVRKAGSPPPTENCTGALVKQPRPGNVPAKACLSSDPQQPVVNKSFKLKAVAQDPDGVPMYAQSLYAGSVGGVSGDAGVLTGKWERISGTSKKLWEERKYPLPSNHSEEFIVDVPPETGAGTVTYRFTITDGYDDGNIYDLQVVIASGNNPPVIKYSSKPTSADPDQVVELDASDTTGTKPLQFAWTIVYGGNPLSPDPASGPKVSFTVPKEADGGQITVTLKVTDADGQSTTDSFTISVSPKKGPTIKLAGVPDTASPDDTVTLDAAGTTGNGKLTFSWTIKYEGNEEPFAQGTDSKLTFRIPVAAAGKKITGTLTVADSDKSSSTSFQITVLKPVFQPLTFPLVSPGRVLQKSNSDINFFNSVAFLNPTGERGRKDRVSVTALNSTGEPVSVTTIERLTGLGALPLSGLLVGDFIPSVVQNESELIKVSAASSRLAGIGMIIASSGGMDAFDLTLKSAKEWVLPYAFNAARESFGFVTLLNDSTSAAKVRLDYILASGARSPKEGEITLKPGENRTMELVTFFDLQNLKDSLGYPIFRADNNIQVMGLYGDSKEIFTVPGSPIGGSAPTLVAPLAFSGGDTSWKTVIPMINRDSKSITVDVELLNSELRSQTKKSMTLRPGVQEVSLSDLFAGTPFGFTALQVSVPGATGDVFSGSVLFKNDLTGAKTLWPLRAPEEVTANRLIYPVVSQGEAWQTSFMVSNLGLTNVALEVSAVLDVYNAKANTSERKELGPVTINLPAGRMRVGGLSAFDLKVADPTGGSDSSLVRGGYLLIKPVDDEKVSPRLLGTGLLYHSNRDGAIDGLSLLPAVR